MSASREKKNRQDLASQGIQDPKAIREAEEKAQQRKANRLYGAIAVVFVLVAALLVVVNSGVLERSATAITVDGENYTAAQMNYYYYGIKNSIINSGYSSFYGIDTSVAMDKQNMSDTAKMLLQVTDEGDITWDQFFRDYATRQLSVQVMAAKEAEANGMGEDDDIRAEVNEVIDNITAGAKEQGYTLKSYLKLAYGSTMTVSTFKKMMTLEEVATHYMQHYQEELSYTESQLEEYYQANSSDFDVASYEYIYFKGTADSTTDADGNTVQPTEAASAAAKTAAAEAAAAALERYQAGESLSVIAADYESTGSYSSVDAGSNNGSALSTWVFDKARTSGSRPYSPVQLTRSMACTTISHSRLLAPIMLVGFTALSVLMSTNRRAPYFRAANAVLYVPSTLFLMASLGLPSISGTCLCAAAWNTTSGLYS